MICKNRPLQEPNPRDLFDRPRERGRALPPSSSDSRGTSGQNLRALPLFRLPPLSPCSSLFLLLRRGHEPDSRAHQTDPSTAASHFCHLPSRPLRNFTLNGHRVLHGVHLFKIYTLNELTNPGWRSLTPTSLPVGTFHTFAFFFDETVLL